MADFIGFIILVVIYLVYKFVQNVKFDSYDMSKVSSAKMVQDSIKGASTSEIRRNLVKGKYDKRPNDLF